MNTNSINTISKYLLLLLLILTGASCNDNDDAEDTSIPVLISQNINDGDVVGPSGYVELTFSKAMRQAPDTEIYFNGGVVRVSINYEKYVIPSLVWKQRMYFRSSCRSINGYAGKSLRRRLLFKLYCQI